VISSDGSRAIDAIDTGATVPSGSGHQGFIRERRVRASIKWSPTGIGNEFALEKKTIGTCTRQIALCSVRLSVDSLAVEW